MARSSNWDAAAIKQLIELYNEGKYSTKQIGEILGFSKNAIVGKINRLELNKNKPVIKAALEEEILEEITAEDQNDQGSINDKNKEEITMQINYTENQEKIYKLEEVSLSMCVWPYGEENFKFCGQKVVFGKPYCKEHFEKAYLKFNKKIKKA